MNLVVDEKILAHVDNDIRTGAIYENALLHIEELHVDADIRDLEDRLKEGLHAASSFYPEMPIEKLLEDVLKYEREFIALMIDSDDNEAFAISKEYSCNIGYGYFDGEFRQTNVCTVILMQVGKKVVVKTAYPDI